MPTSATRTAAIDVEAVDVEFPIYHGNSRSLKRTVFAAASGRLQEDNRRRIVVQALRSVSLRLPQRRAAGPGRP